MKIKYRIDRIDIREVDSIRYIAITGWAFSTTGGTINYSLQVNKQDMPVIFSETIRPDILHEYEKYHPRMKCGFRVYVDISEVSNITSIDLFATIDGETKRLFKADSNQVAALLNHESIVYAIDYKHLENDGNTSIQGWAYSLLGDKELEFVVIDSKGNEVESTTRAYNREDLYKLKMVPVEQKYCGFRTSFRAIENENYFIKVTNQKETVIIDLAKELKGRSFFQKIMYLFRLMNWKNIKRGLKYLRRNGISGFLKRVRKGPSHDKIHYDTWFNANKVTDEQLKKQRTVEFKYQPKISVIVPTYNTPKKFLHEMIDSVLNQSYGNFELCIADGSQGNTEVQTILEEYHQKDSRVIYKVLNDNFGIAGNTNEALAMATGEYVGLFDHDDLLTPDALYEIVKSLQDVKYDILYTDEDKVNSDGTEFDDPNLKPDFSLDLLRSHNYITHFFVVKTDIINGVGGFRSEFDGAQDYDVMFRCIEQAETIYHIPKVLYHWRMHANSTAENPESKMYCYEAGQKAISEHYKRVGVDATVEIMDLWGMYHTTYATPGNPLVSIIIPNKDEKETLKTCIESLYKKNAYQNFEIIIVENNSESTEIFEYYKDLEKKHTNIKVVYWDNDFNYSAINNYGVSFAKGEYLLFLNNDTEVIAKTAVSELLGCCMREEVGIVGAKLLYEDNTVQHAGIVLGFGGFAGHIFTGIGRDDVGFMVRARINGNYSAVTAACMMVDKKVFDEVGGFDESFKVGLNDVDFCLKVRQINKLVVFNAFSLWYHYESKSRGYEDTAEKIRRLEGEIKHFQDKWGDVLRKGDPYYNKNFKIEHGPFILG